MNTARPLSAELDALRAATDRMIQTVKDGGLVDLAALEESVAGFCARVRALPQGRSDLRGGLIALMDDLARLDGLIRQAHSEAGQRLGETSQRRRATVAYGSAPVRK
jgi:hypothetical protein